MTLAIGRIPPIAEPMNWTSTGDLADISGRLQAATPAAALILRDQLLGYNASAEEPVVSLVSTTEAKLNGFYRLHSVSVDTTPDLIANGNLAYQIHAERIQGFAAAALESFLIGAVMANSFSVTTLAQPWHSVPAGALDYQVGYSPVSTVTRTAEDGDQTFYWAVPAPASYKALARFNLLPADYYKGAAQIQTGLAGGSLVPVVGTQTAPALGDWRLTNGLVRVEGTGAAQGTGAGLKVNWYKSGAWGAQHTFYLSFANIGNLHGEEPAIRILYNTPEMVIVRVIQTTNVINAGSVYIDVRLRRGARVVRCYASWLAVDAATFAHNGVLACTALTAGGIIATAADGNGNKVVLLCSQTMTQDLVNGKLTQPSSTFKGLDFGIGAQTDVTTGDAGQDLAYQYLAAQGETMRVVGR